MRNIDDGVKKRLRLRAAENGRSLEAEVREILAGSVQAAGRAKTGLDLFKPILDVVKRYGGVELEIPPRTPMRDVEFGSTPPQAAATKAEVVSKKGDADASAVRETHPNARISTSRKTYGDGFATGVRGDTKLEGVVRDAAVDFRRETNAKRSSYRKK